MAETNTVEKHTFVYDTQGVEQTRQKVERLAGSLDKLQGAQTKATDAEGKGAASSDKAAQARARMAAVQERAQRQIEMEARAVAQAQAAQDAYSRSLQGLTDAQIRAVQASAQISRAANDNATSLEKESSAFREAGKWALEHPLLVISGSVLAARGLSAMAATAGVALGAASLATARFAAGSTAMGGAVASGGTLAARGLAVAGDAATAIAGGLAAYAAKVSGATTAVGLLTRALGLVPGFLGPIGLAFTAFQVGSAAIGKAGHDLEALIALGERSQHLDLAAPFVKSFDSLGAKIRATSDEMQAALQRASSFVKDSFNQQNQLTKLFDEISATGVAGPNGLNARSQLTEASSTEDRIRAALSAMKELDALGLHLASIKIGEAVFGSDFVERMRTANTTAEQISGALQAAGEKELLKQEQVDRAVELNRKIDDTKQGISDAVAITFDFSAAALAAKEAWLLVLEAVRYVIDKINEANQASSDLIGTLTTKALGGLKAAGDYAKGVLADYGVIFRQQAETAKTATVVLPTITAVQRHDVAGPFKPENTQAAKDQAAAVRDTASAYDLLIKRTEDRIQELDLETQSIGKNEGAVVKLKLQNELARAAQKSGIDVTAEMRDTWDKLGDRVAASTERLHDARRAFDLMKEGQRELAGNFATFADDLILGGKKLDEAFKSIASTLTSSTLKAVLTGEGPLAGILGTASKERGGVGGLLGGSFSLSSLFGGGSSEANSPIAGAQGPIFQSASFYSGIEKAVSGGSEDGITSAFAPLLKPKTNAVGASGGFLSSPLGGTLAAGAVGASVGYSTGSPLMGGLGGVVGGALLGSEMGTVAGLPGMAVGAVVGGVMGVIGGSYGHAPSRKKDRDHERRERLREYASCGDADGFEPLHA